MLSHPAGRGLVTNYPLTKACLDVGLDPEAQPLSLLRGRAGLTGVAEATSQGGVRGGLA